MELLKIFFRIKKIYENDTLLNFLKKIKNEEIKNLTIVFWESGKFEKKSKLAKFLLANSKSQEFNFLEGIKFLNWIKEEIKTKGRGKVGISNVALQKVAAFIGSRDLNLVNREVEKLVNFRNQGEICETDLEMIVKSKISTDIFRTVDAISEGDKSTAMRYLHDHLNSGDDPFYLLSMYFYQFRNLLKVKPLLKKNFSGVGNGEKTEASSLCREKKRVASQKFFAF